MKHLRNALLLAGLVLVLVVANRGILHRQAIIEDGRLLLLELRPLDPRSLIQGDYMRLRYAEKAFPDQATAQSMPRKGTVVLALDENGVGRFLHLDDGSPLEPNEIRMRYKLRLQRGELRYGAESFHFQEGHADLFDQARYGVLRVDETGESVLVGLADEDRQLIRRK